VAREIPANVPAGTDHAAKVVCDAIEVMCAALKTTCDAVKVTILLLGCKFHLCALMLASSGVLFLGAVCSYNDAVLHCLVLFNAV
jgi:hypothetical protein